MVKYRDTQGEEILQTVRLGQKKKVVEREIADFYDALSDQETVEQARWGEFARGEFPNEIA
jgi:hypothetical protein